MTTAARSLSRFQDAIPNRLGCCFSGQGREQACQPVKGGGASMIQQRGAGSEGSMLVEGHGPGRREEIAPTGGAQAAFGTSHFVRLATSTFSD
jgi:hypothetical protein